jgi:hypothetical protein
MVLNSLFVQTPSTDHASLARLGARITLAISRNRTVTRQAHRQARAAVEAIVTEAFSGADSGIHFTDFKPTTPSPAPTKSTSPPIDLSDEVERYRQVNTTCDFLLSKQTTNKD